MTKSSIGRNYARVMPSRHCNNGPAFMLFIACTPKLERQSHVSTLTCMLFVIASYELLLMNRASHLASLKLLGGGRPSPLNPRMSATTLELGLLFAARIMARAVLKSRSNCRLP